MGAPVTAATACLGLGHSSSNAGEAVSSSGVLVSTDSILLSGNFCLDLDGFLLDDGRGFGHTFIIGMMPLAPLRDDFGLLVACCVLHVLLLDTGAAATRQLTSIAKLDIPPARRKPAA